MGRLGMGGHHRRWLAITRIASCGAFAACGSGEPAGPSLPRPVAAGAAGGESEGVVADPPPAATGRFRWARSYATQGSINGVAFDAQGSLFFVTTLVGRVRFGDVTEADDPGLATALESAVVKLDASGNATWVTRVTSGSSVAGAGTLGAAVAVDAAGDVYVVGESFAEWVMARGTGVLKPVGATDELHTAAGSFGFAMKLGGATGEPIWGRSFGIPNVRILETGFTSCRSVAASSDHVAVGCTFGGGSIAFVRSGGVTDARDGSALVARLDPASGEVLWANALGSAWGSAPAIAVAPGGDVFAAGTFDGLTLVDSAASPNLALARQGGDPNGFLLRLAASDGKALWAKSYGDGSVAPRAVALDGRGLAIAGGYVGLQGQAGRGLVLAVDAATGQTRWTRQVSGYYRAPGFALATDQWGEVLVGGADLASVVNGFQANMVSGYVAKWAADGTPLWTRVQVPIYPYYDYGMGEGSAPVVAVATSSAGDVAYGGRFFGSVDLSSGESARDTVMGSGSYVVRVSP